LIFWENIIERFTDNSYIKDRICVDYDIEQPERILFKFNNA